MHGAIAESRRERRDYLVKYQVNPVRPELVEGQNINYLLIVLLMVQQAHHER